MTSPSTIPARSLTEQEKHRTKENELRAEIGVTVFLIGAIFLAGTVYGVDLETSAIFLGSSLLLFFVKWNMDILYLNGTAEDNKDAWEANTALMQERISAGTPLLTTERSVMSAKD